MITSINSNPYSYCNYKSDKIEPKPQKKKDSFNPSTCSNYLPGSSDRAKKVAFKSLTSVAIQETRPLNTVLTGKLMSAFRSLTNVAIQGTRSLNIVLTESLMSAFKPLTGVAIQTKQLITGSKTEPILPDFFKSKIESLMSDCGEHHNELGKFYRGYSEKMKDGRLANAFFKQGITDAALGPHADYLRAKEEYYKSVLRISSNNPEVEKAIENSKKHDEAYMNSYLSLYAPSIERLFQSFNGLKGTFSLKFPPNSKEFFEMEKMLADVPKDHPYYDLIKVLKPSEKQNGSITKIPEGKKEGKVLPKGEIDLGIERAQVEHILLNIKETEEFFKKYHNPTKKYYSEFSEIQNALLKTKNPSSLVDKEGKTFKEVCEKALNNYSNVFSKYHAFAAKEYESIETIKKVLKKYLILLEEKS